jgi:hypothetical protein
MGLMDLRRTPRTAYCTYCMASWGLRRSHFLAKLLKAGCGGSQHRPQSGGRQHRTRSRSMEPKWKSRVARSGPGLPDRISTPGSAGRVVTARGRKSRKPEHNVHTPRHGPRSPCSPYLPCWHPHPFSLRSPIRSGSLLISDQRRNRRNAIRSNSIRRESERSTVNGR